MADLTGQPYLPIDRATADALATLPGIAIAVHDATLDDPPDVAARPVEQLAAVASRAKPILMQRSSHWPGATWTRHWRNCTSQPPRVTPTAVAQR